MSTSPVAVSGLFSRNSPDRLSVQVLLLRVILSSCVPTGIGERKSGELGLAQKLFNYIPFRAECCLRSIVSGIRGRAEFQFRWQNRGKFRADRAPCLCHLGTYPTR